MPEIGVLDRLVYLVYGILFYALLCYRLITFLDFIFLIFFEPVLFMRIFCLTVNIGLYLFLCCPFFF